MKIDPTGKIVPPLTDETRAEQTQTSTSPDKDLIESGASEQNRFAKIIESAQGSADIERTDRAGALEQAQENQREAAEAAQSAAEEKVADVEKKVLAGVIIATGLVVGMTGGGVPIAIALGVAALLKYTDVGDAAVAGIEWLGSSIEDLGSWMGGPLEDSAEWLGGAMKTVAGGAADVASDVGDAIVDGAGAVADAVSDAPGAVADAVSDVCDW